MLSTRTLITLCVLCWLAACTQTPKKSQTASEVAKNQEEMTEVMETEKVYKTFNAETIDKEQHALNDFVENPYLQETPNVTEAESDQFAKALRALKKEDWEVAETALMNLTQYSAHLSGPAYNLALLKSSRGDRESAIKFAALAVERNVYNLDARNLLACLYRETGQFDQAEKLWLENLTLWGGHAASYRNLGILYDLYRGKPAQALGYYKQYNLLQDEEDKKVKGWIVTIDRRLAQISRQQAVPETSVAPADVESVNDTTENTNRVKTDERRSVQ